MSASAPVSDALHYLLSLEHLGIKLGLDQIRALVAGLDRPDAAYRSIVIAGTNGKGSVTAMVERGLRAAGYRTGRYTSPHLVKLEERIAVNGEPISADDLDQLTLRLRQAAAGLPAPPSFFEATTAMALDEFRRAAVDVAVLEVGLGGRLDATNVVHPIGVAITAIDLDHEQYLGDTIEAIAREKAGVIKAGCVVILSRNPDGVRRIVEAACAAAGAEFVYAPEGVDVATRLEGGRARISLHTPRARYADVDLKLRGRHQAENAVTSVRLLEELAARRGLAIERPAIETALCDVEWPGRLELRQWCGHPVLLDGAHNPAGARALAAYLRETYGRPVPIVMGVMRDTRIEEMLAALAPAASAFVFTSAGTARAALPSELADIARQAVPTIAAAEVPEPLDALARALPLGSPVVVAGSLFLVGAIRPSTSW